MQTYTTRDAIRIIGPELRDAINNWAIRSELPSIARDPKQGVKRIFTAAQLFVMSVRLRLQDTVCRKHSLPVAQFLSSLSPEHFVSCFAAGRRYVLLMDGHVLPMLGTREELLSDQVMAATQIAAGDNVRLAVTLIDLLPIYEQVMQRIAAYESQREAVAAEAVN
jgi:hypothetical protein